MSTTSCPLCNSQVASEKASLAQHFSLCSISTLKSCVSDGSLDPTTLSPNIAYLLTLSSDSPPSPSKPSKRRASLESATIKKRLKLLDIDEKEEEEEEEEGENEAEDGEEERDEEYEEEEEEDEEDVEMALPSFNFMSTKEKGKGKAVDKGRGYKDEDKPGMTFISTKNQDEFDTSNDTRTMEEIEAFISKFLQRIHQTWQRDKESPENQQKVQDVLNNVKSYMQYIEETLIFSAVSLGLPALSPLLFETPYLRNIKGVDLSRNNIEYLPDTLTNLVNLEVLSLQGIMLKTLPPLHTCTRLISLDIAFNAIEDFPVTICHITSLTELKLSGNKLTQLPIDIVRLTNLEGLLIDENLLKILPPGIVEMRWLKYLSVSSGRSLPMHSLDTTMESLYMVSNLGAGMSSELRIMLTSAERYCTSPSFESVPDALFTMPQLRQLSIEGHKLHSLPPAIDLPTIEKLFLSLNNFTEFPQSLCTLSSLQFLDLSHNNISSISNEFSQLQSLTILNLNDNKIAELPHSIDTIPLRILNLENNAITQLPLSFTRLSNLTSLDIGDNPLPPALLQSISKPIAVFFSAIVTYYEKFSLGYRLISRTEFTNEKIVDEAHKIAKYTWTQHDRDYEVIVKNLPENNRDLAEREIGLLMRIESEHVVKFYGICSNPLAIVMEYMPGGSLGYRLKQLREENKTLTTQQIFSILRDTARGMMHIHKKHVLHQDLHHNNIFVSDDLMQAKIGDFGLSRLRGAPAAISKPYVDITAPEVFEDENATSEASDVFAFSLIMYEVLTGDTPYIAMDPHEVQGFVVSGGRPKLPEFTHVPPTEINYYELLKIEMASCWAQNPTTRSTFEQIATRIESYASVVLGISPHTSLYI